MGSTAAMTSAARTPRTPGMTAPLVGMWATTTLETGLRPVDAKAR